jgi:polyphosphate kinase
MYSSLLLIQTGFWEHQYHSRIGLAMTNTTEKAPRIDLHDPQYFYNQHLSWIEFNRRVLHEALDPRNPLLERVKFTAIFTSNLDEFFMVRVAILKEEMAADVAKLSPDGRTPGQIIAAIREALAPLITAQDELFAKELRPQLEAEGIYILNYIDLDKDQRAHLDKYFEERIFPQLTPLGVDLTHPFPTMSNLSLNLAVAVKDPDSEEELFARLKVPADLPRFVQLPETLRHKNGKSALWAAIPIEQIIAHNLDSLFPGMLIQECIPFRITRDSDIDYEDEAAGSLLQAIQGALAHRHFMGSVVRLEIPEDASDFIRETLIKGVEVEEKDVYTIRGLLGLKDLFALMGAPRPDLKDPSYTPVVHPRLKPVVAEKPSEKERRQDVFSIIREGDILFHHPYESFTASVELFITKAAYDPAVKAIKITLYRTSSNSPIVKALIAAAEQKKQVVAVVELKARFDEESNINWAEMLENAGVHVTYGKVGLKTHTKVVLVVRQEDEILRRYVHIGTGNYNSKTAGLYTDLGLLSCREELGADLTDLFNYLTGFSKQKTFRKLLVSPMTMRDRMTAMIDREIAHAKAGKPAHIIAKMNALVDPGMIRKLYEASIAGVTIELIIRGMCSLLPGLKGVSETIQVISIVGRYLEHSRIFYFHNDGKEEFYIGSADWMTRNLDRRVEAVTPVEDSKLKKELKELLHIFLSDNRNAWELQSDGTYQQREPKAGEAERSAQSILMARASRSPA